MKKSGQLLATALLLLAAGGCSDRDVETAGAGTRAAPASTNAVPPRPAGPRKAPARVKPADAALAQFERALSARGRELAGDIRKRLEYHSEKGDIPALIKLSRKALASGDRDLRLAVVRELGWHCDSEEAALELLSYAADEDAEVSGAAVTFAGNAVDLIPDTEGKAMLIAALAKVHVDAADRQILLTAYEGMKPSLALPELAALCESPNAALAAEARQTYRNVAGEAFIGRAHVPYLVKRLKRRGR